MEPIIKHDYSKFMLNMPQVKKYENKLNSLTDWWSKVSLIGKINSHNLASIILDDMHDTKEKFSELHIKLLDNLLLEHLKKVVLDDTAKSQVTIDILIRNLFERTADIGFLATDEDIRNFLLSTNVNTERVSIEERLCEYVSKYSVYNEIVILDLEGNVKANLDKNNRISVCKDSLIQKTLETKDDYIETFGHSDLQPTKNNSLIYSCKITKNNDSHSEVLGVLCLCFRFENEMSSIFNNLNDNSDSVLLLMSDAGNVIASSDAELISLNTKFNYHQSTKLISYKSNDFLVTSSESKGYQGFYGLGWWAMVMTPLKSAFTQVGNEVEQSSSPNNLLSSSLFSEELKGIHKASKIVNDDLSLVVLNGQITSLRQEAAEFMPVLEAIKQIGENTANIFSDSINDLQSTVISSYMNEVRFIAALAVDIMDRNLYERANDCRWWALTSAFKGILSKNKITEDDQQRLSNILYYINDLYTVYTNLYIYNNEQKVIAVSNENQSWLVGKSLDKSTGSSEALTLNNSQQYSVSPFIKTALYDNKQTYIYNAAITSNKAQKPIGGIGIVFDSEPEFKAILTDTLPKDEHGETLKGCFSMFADRTGKIIAVTDKSPCVIDEQLALNNHLFALAKGDKIAEIQTIKDVQYVLGVAASSGYREYKTTNDYKNDILTFVCIPI